MDKENDIKHDNTNKKHVLRNKKHKDGKARKVRYLR